MLASSFLFDVESRWRLMQTQQYAALAAAQNQWWGKCTKVIPTGSRREILAWVQETARLESRGPLGGGMGFEEMTMIEAEFIPEFVSRGLRMRKAQFEDLDGNGIATGTSWIKQITAQAAYWPQRSIANLLKIGHAATSLGYDGVPYFSDSHPYDKFNAGAGFYSNIIPSVPLTSDLDVGLASLSTVFATIGAIMQSNGFDPRFLKPQAILCSPTAFPSAAQITKAQYIAMTAGGGTTAGGSADMAGIVATMGYGEVVMVPELATFESGTTYFVIAGADGVPADELAGFVYLEREPFQIRYYTGSGGGDGVDAILGRSNELEWQAEGRNIAGYGHPFAVFKCTAGA